MGDVNNSMNRILQDVGSNSNQGEMNVLLGRTDPPCHPRRGCKEEDSIKIGSELYMLAPYKFVSPTSWEGIYGQQHHQVKELTMEQRATIEAMMFGLYEDNNTHRCYDDTIVCTSDGCSNKVFDEVMNGQEMAPPTSATGLLASAAETKRNHGLTGSLLPPME